eukprot:3944314-Amphidinium_carterae.1
MRITASHYADQDSTYSHANNKLPRSWHWQWDYGVKDWNLVAPEVPLLIRCIPLRTNKASKNSQP